MASQGASSGSGSPWSEETKEKFESKDLSLYLDPCQAVASRSIKCLHRNGGDRSMCQEYFQAYRDCKKEWITRRREGGKRPDATPS